MFCGLGFAKVLPAFRKYRHLAPQSFLNISMSCFCFAFPLTSNLNDLYRKGFTRTMVLDWPKVILNTLKVNERGSGGGMYSHT